MGNDISAQEAASILGISLPTLYTYVSRGLLTASQPDKARKKSYLRDEVLRLAARRADGKRGGHQVAAAMQWGVPVLETRISHIAKGSLYYRGKNVLSLAGNGTLESVACLIWDGGMSDHFAHPSPLVPSSLVTSVRKSSNGLPMLEAAMTMLPQLALALPVQEQTMQGRFQHAATLMRLLAALLLEMPPAELVSATPLHLQIARAWKANDVQTRFIRSALVLLADHELNASTFTVRCVSSTGASLAASLAAGLAALSGSLHGGGSAQAFVLLQTAMASNSIEHSVTSFFSERDPALAGFGNPLYPDGDPRASFLLKRLVALSCASTQSATILHIGEVASNLTGAAPNMDFALAAMSTTFAWPAQASMILYALARSAGWIGHAFEQADTGKLIRPRGRYIGTFA